MNEEMDGDPRRLIQGDSLEEVVSGWESVIAV
jgi:hypothetical protein